MNYFDKNIWKKSLKKYKTSIKLKLKFKIDKRIK